MADPAGPRWDLESFFPGPDSPALRDALAVLANSIRSLESDFAAEGIGRRDEPGLADGDVDRFERFCRRFCRLYDDFRLVRGYLGCCVAADAADDAAQKAFSRLRNLGVGLQRLGIRWTRWTGTLDAHALVQESSEAAAHAHALRVAAERARRLMDQDLEDLAAELQPAGVTAWARLHSDVSALLAAEVTVDNETRRLPMSAVRSLAHHSDRETRRRAYEAELAAWKSVEVPLAAALNGVKGWQGTVRRRRGYADDLEPTLLDNAIDEATLDAMQAACKASFPDFRRYMHAKARLLGVPRLAWYDISAPLGGSARRFSWDEAEQFILDQFGRYGEPMRALAARAFAGRWIDAPPAAGKEGGAFCAGLRGDESRILMNYDGSFSSVSTLAHELGHAYHNFCLRERTALQRHTPSTLAETASIFCEQLCVNAALSSAENNEKAGILEGGLQRDLMVVVDIHSRFLFEQRVFARRSDAELTPHELCELMLEAQRNTYGDGLDPDALHPYMWAVKGHYYGPTFYNYPYTFGLLFGQGLYAVYEREPDRFRRGYDDLLSRTGMADAAQLAAGFGLDIRRPEFWEASLDVVRRSIDQFEALATAPAASGPAR